MDIIDVKKQMLAEGFELNRLTKELTKPSVRKMSHKERCEHINTMRFTYGEVRFTPPKILRRRLGLDLNQVLSVGNSILMLEKSCEIFFESRFHISRIQNGKIVDAGFLYGKTCGTDNEIANDPVMDVEHDGFHGWKSGPLCLADAPQWRLAA